MTNPAPSETAVISSPVWQSTDPRTIFKSVTYHPSTGVLRFNARHPGQLAYDAKFEAVLATMLEKYAISHVKVATVTHPDLAQPFLLCLQVSIFEGLVKAFLQKVQPMLAIKEKPHAQDQLAGFDLLKQGELEIKVMDAPDKSKSNLFIIPDKKEKAKTLYGKNNFKEAAGLYQHIVDIAPYDALAWYHLGHVHLQMNDYRQALYCFEEARQRDLCNIEINTSCSISISILARQGREMAQQGNYQEAQYCFQQILDVLPDQFEANLRFVRLLMHRKYFRDGLFQLKRICETQFELGAHENVRLAIGEWLKSGPEFAVQLASNYSNGGFSKDLVMTTMILDKVEALKAQEHNNAAERLLDNFARQYLSKNRGLLPERVRVIKAQFCQQRAELLMGEGRFEESLEILGLIFRRLNNRDMNWLLLVVNIYFQHLEAFFEKSDSNAVLAIEKAYYAIIKFVTQLRADQSDEGLQDAILQSIERFATYHFEVGAHEKVRAVVKILLQGRHKFAILMANQFSVGNGLSDDAEMSAIVLDEVQRLQGVGMYEEAGKLYNRFSSTYQPTHDKPLPSRVIDIVGQNFLHLAHLLMREGRFRDSLHQLCQTKLFFNNKVEWSSRTIKYYLQLFEAVFSESGFNDTPAAINGAYQSILDFVTEYNLEPHEWKLAYKSIFKSITQISEQQFNVGAYENVRASIQPLLRHGGAAIVSLANRLSVDGLGLAYDNAMTAMILDEVEYLHDDKAYKRARKLLSQFEKVYKAGEQGQLPNRIKIIKARFHAAKVARDLSKSIQVAAVNPCHEAVPRAVKEIMSTTGQVRRALVARDVNVPGGARRHLNEVVTDGAENADPGALIRGVCKGDSLLFSPASSAPFQVSAKENKHGRNRKY